MHPLDSLEAFVDGFFPPPRMTRMDTSPKAAARPTILDRAGPWTWIWPGASRSRWPDPDRCVADLRELGIVGIIPMSGLSATGWAARVAPTFRAGGIEVAVGMGMDGAHNVADYVRAIVGGIDHVGRVSLDWEKPSKWETPAGNVLATEIVDGVLAQRPAAAAHITDAPWWAPLKVPTGGGSHPRAPTKIFGKLCGGERYPQCYGAARGKDGEAPKDVQGRSARYLAWSRDPSQYPALGPWEIRPAYQMYARTVQDHVDALLAERTQCLWDLAEADRDCRTALGAVRRLRALGYDGPGAIKAFQQAASLVVDGIVGPRTLAALAALAKA